MLNSEHNESVQSAGDYAIQAQGSVIYNIKNYYIMDKKYDDNLTTEHVKQIVNEMLGDAEKNLMSKFREEYKQTAHKLSDILISKMDKKDVLGAFEDPGFLSVMFQAYRTAFLMQGKDDLEILSELVLNRAAHPKIDSTKIAVEKAISIVNNVSDSALKGLAAFYCLVHIIPVRGDVYKSLGVYADMFAEMDPDDLPMRHGWLNELDILGALRASEVGANMKSFDDIIAEVFSGFLVRGVETDSDSYYENLRILREVAIPENVFIPHEFRPNHMRLPVARNGFDVIEQMMIPQSDGNLCVIDLDDSKRKALNQVYINISGGEGIEKSEFDKMKKQLTDAVGQFEVLRKLKNWWNQLNPSFDVNEVGLILGYTYAKSKVKNFPDRM